VGCGNGLLQVHADRALKFVRFFFPSNFLPLPELLRVLTHLIGNGRVRSVAFHPDGKKIASGSDDKTIKVWDTQTGQCAWRLTGHSHSVMSVAWNNDGTKLASGSCDKTVRIWSVGSAGTFECESTLSGHSDCVNAVSWSPDGTMLASGSDDKTIKLWDAQSGKENSNLTLDSSVTSVAFSPDGSQIAVGHFKKIQLFDTQTQVKLGSPLNGHSRPVMSVTWNNDGTMLASGSFDQTVRIWSVGSAGTSECESTPNGHSRPVTSVTWNNDGSKLATGSYDETIKIWAVSSAGTFECESTLNGHSDR
jgi:WD40 repeat protein